MSKTNPYQRTLALKVVIRDPTPADLFAAYEKCVLDQHRIPFEKALTIPALAVGIKNTAKAAIIRRGGK